MLLQFPKAVSSVKLVRFKLIFRGKKISPSFWLNTDLYSWSCLQAVRVLLQVFRGNKINLNLDNQLLLWGRDNFTARIKPQQWLILVLNLIEGYLTGLLGLTIHKEEIFIKKHMFLVLFHATSVTSHCGWQDAPRPKEVPFPFSSRVL